MKKAFVVLATTLSIGTAFAQTAATPAAPATAASPASAAAAKREQHVEQRIAYLHSALKITQAQESQWNAFADVMRENNQTMMQLFEQRKAGTEQRSALDDMKQYAQISQARADGMQKLVTAFEPLYASLSPEQKALADKTFREQHEHRPGKQGKKHRQGGKAAPAPAPESGGQ
jgi:esterase/lipase